MTYVFKSMKEIVLPAQRATMSAVERSKFVILSYCFTSTGAKGWPMSHHLFSELYVNYA